jgi:predicted nuclease of predicted toxin-antitoxin system
MSLRFKTDENLPIAARRLIEGRGHDVQSELDEGLGGHPDTEIIEQCRSESRVLVTLDRGFADIRAYPRDSHTGVLLLHPSSQSVDSITNLLLGALELADNQPLQGRLWIVEPARIRIRQ